MRGRIWGRIYTRIAENDSQVAYTISACMAHLSGRHVCLPVKDSDKVKDVMQKHSRHTGAVQDRSVIFRGKVLDTETSLGGYGIESANLHFVSLGQSGIALGESDIWPLTPFPGICLSVFPEKVFDSQDGSVCAIKIIPKKNKDYPIIKFETIRLSCESHQYVKGNPYAGFILYAFRPEKNEHVLQDWRLNEKHCKSAYFVVQNTNSQTVLRYRDKAPGLVHGAVYWNVFGEGADPSMAVGEGFSLQSEGCFFTTEVLKWHSRVFNINGDSYHDGRNNVSDLTKKCVEGIMKKWMQTSQTGRTYSVKELLGTS